MEAVQLIASEYAVYSSTLRRYVIHQLDFHALGCVYQELVKQGWKYLPDSYECDSQLVAPQDWLPRD